MGAFRVMQLTPSGKVGGLATIKRSRRDEQVERGRPQPYMIHKLANDLDIHNTRHIAKIGDTIPDMLEGINAKCGLNIGVLSGAEDYDGLYPFSDIIMNNIMDLDDLPPLSPPSSPPSSPPAYQQMLLKYNISS